MGVMSHGNLAKTINDYISLYFNVKESQPKLLYQALPELSTLRDTVYSFISKVIMVRKHLYFFPQEDVLKLFDGLHNAYEFLFYHCVIQL